MTFVKGVISRSLFVFTQNMVKIMITSMVMIENYLSGLIWKNFMKNKYVKKGLMLLQIKEK